MTLKHSSLWNCENKPEWVCVPELPDLEVAKDNLNATIMGETITNVELGQPMILRRPTEAAFKRTLNDRFFETTARRNVFGSASDAP